MRYAVFSGPQGEVTNFEGLFNTTKEADIQVEGGEDNGSFYKIVDTELGTVYTTEGPLPEAELTPDRDYVTRLESGEGTWIEVNGQYVVRIVIDLPTGGLGVRVLHPGKEDEQPIDEMLILG